MRSVQNMEVISDFFKSLTTLGDVGQGAIEVIKILRPHFHTAPEQCIPIVNTLTGDISDLKNCEEVLQYITSMITTEHLPKKKLTLVDMLNGVINSIGKYKHYDLNVQLMTVFVNSWSKFSDEEELKLICEMLEKIIKLNQKPTQEIA